MTRVCPHSIRVDPVAFGAMSLRNVHQIMVGYPTEKNYEYQLLAKFRLIVAMGGILYNFQHLVRSKTKTPVV